MDKPLLVIKFGGSIISYKDQMPPKARTDIIQMLVSQLVEIHKQYRIILIHGAGSFAHQYSHDYALPQGIQSERQVEGFSIADSSLLSLHVTIVNEMVTQGLPAMGLPPHAFIQKVNKELKDIPLEGIKNFLRNNQIPVMYGDVVIDEVQGCAILSGDEIAGFMARQLNAEKVIFLSDVDGIYSDNPKTNLNATHISEITRDNLDEVLSTFVKHNEKDVSGEMKGKILAIQQMMAGIPVYIIDGQKPMALQELVTQQVRSGTKLVL